MRCALHDKRKLSAWSSRFQTCQVVFNFSLRSTVCIYSPIFKIDFYKFVSRMCQIRIEYPSFKYISPVLPGRVSISSLKIWLAKLFSNYFLFPPHVDCQIFLAAIIAIKGPFPNYRHASPERHKGISEEWAPRFSKIKSSILP